MPSGTKASNFAENTHNPCPYEVNTIKNIINVDQKVKLLRTSRFKQPRNTYGNFLQLFKNRGRKTMLFVSFLIE